MTDAILAHGNAPTTIISRADAIAQGLKRYFTGMPCALGHIAQRNVGTNNECIACKRIRDKAYGERTKAKKAEYDRQYRILNDARLRTAKAEYRDKNKDAQKARHAAWSAANAEHRREYREANKEKRNAQKRAWYEKNKRHARRYSVDYNRRKKLEDLGYKLRQNLRIRLATAVREGAKAGSAVSDLGCTIDELKSYLEAKFTDGMTWGNWGRKGWHIDHKKPLAAYDLTDADQVKEACHYTNLQPLWWRDNIAKGAREF